MRTTAASTGSTSNITTDHEFIRRWTEARGARPTCVRGTGGPGDIGVLRLDFPGYSGAETLEHISWDEWFEKFDERDLALLYQDTAAAGEPNNFNKLVSRSGVEGEETRAGESMRLGESAQRKSRRNALRPAVEILEIDVEEVPTGGRSRMMGEM